MMEAMSQNIRLDPINSSNLPAIEKILEHTMGTPAGWAIMDCGSAGEVIDLITTDHNSSGYYYAITLDDDIVLGFIGYRWRPDARGYSLVTYLSAESRGLGVNLIAKALLIQAFSYSNIPLHAFIKEDNIRSLRAMDRILQRHDNWDVRKYKDKRSGKVLRHYSFMPTTAVSNLWSEERVQEVASHLRGLITSSG